MMASIETSIQYNSSQHDQRIEEDQAKPTKPSWFLEKLPPELVRSIISYLSASDLACIGATCRVLAEHASDDLLWGELVNERLPSRIEDPGIFKSFRRLYLAYNACWFIPQYKIWFADNEPTGALILARYNNSQGVIEGYQIVATRGNPEFQFWKGEPTVMIQSFEPDVRMPLEVPIVFLEDPDPSSQTAPKQFSAREDEQQMYLALQHDHDYGALSFCSTVSSQQEPTTSPESHWPPPIIPSSTRTSRHVEGKGPDLIEKVSHFSDSAFRIDFRPVSWEWELGSNTVFTFSTLDPKLYVPTKEKPYQGIWVGDYSTHGCEFLLVLQSDIQEGVPGETQDIDNTDEDGSCGADTEFGIGQRGRLECVKLTGDMNVPRGQYSWVAKDIGPRGSLGVATDDPFKGARMVQCEGHVAGIGFQDDIFIPSQLILISTDLIAHWWKEMGHASYLRRVDIDSLLET